MINTKFSFFMPSSMIHTELDRETRQKKIWDELKFVCDCNACTYDYPILTVTEQVQQYEFINPIHHFRLCDEFDFNAVKELIPNYIEYLTRNARKYPYKHTMIAENLLSAFFRLIFREEVPLDVKYLLQQSNIEDN